MKEDNIIIYGYNEHLIKCIHYQFDNNKIAVLFPGFAYSTDAPFFFYLLDILKDENYDILSISQRFNEWELFNTLPDRKECIHMEGKKVYDYVMNIKDYTQFLWIGKSLGTASIQGFIDMIKDNKRNKCIFCTPFNNGEDLVKSLYNTIIESLIIWGTNDKYYKKEVADDFKKNQTTNVLIINDLDHGLCSKYGINETLESMKVIMHTCQKFIIGT